MAFAGENPPVSPFFKGGRLQRWEAERKNLKSAFEKIRFSVLSLKKHALSRVEGRVREILSNAGATDGSTSKKKITGLGSGSRP